MTKLRIVKAIDSTRFKPMWGIMDGTSRLLSFDIEEMMDLLLTEVEVIEKMKITLKEILDETRWIEVDNLIDEAFKNPLTVNEYQNKAIETAIYGEGQKIIYPTLGLCGEAGEVADKVKKVLRDSGGNFSDEIKLEIAKEIGDVVWYIAALCKDLGYTMEEVCEMNLTKLASRKERNMISGSGDNR